MRKKLTLLIVSLGIAAAPFIDSSGSPQGQRQADYKENRCVDCHSRTTSPAQMAGRYLDWHFSGHATAGVGCDKCHGGDATSRERLKAHNGVLPSAQTDSRISSVNLPQTCGSCHRVIVNSFVESTHYEKLKTTGLGPTCNTCHAHMSSAIATSPPAASAYCAYCHNTINGLQPQRPDIPQRAQKVLESIQSTDYLIKSADELLASARNKRIDVAEETEDARLLRNLVIEAKVAWHAFNLDGVQSKSTKAFAEGIRIRDQLMKKLDQK